MVTADLTVEVATAEKSPVERRASLNWRIKGPVNRTQSCAPRAEDSIRTARGFVPGPFSWCGILEGSCP